MERCLVRTGLPCTHGRIRHTESTYVVGRLPLQVSKLRREGLVMCSKVEVDSWKQPPKSIVMKKEADMLESAVEGA